MTIDKIYVAKKIVTGAVGIGTAKIIRAIVENNTASTSTLDKVTMSVGAYALAGLVADKTSEYTDAKIENFVVSLKKLLHEDPPTVVAEPIA